MKRMIRFARVGSQLVVGAALLGLAAPVSTCTGPQHPAAPRTPHTAESYVRPYTADFGYGCNMGYYGSGWNDEQLASAISRAGGQTIRVTLPEQFLAKWEWQARRAAFRHHTTNLGLRELVCFVGEPSAEHRDKTVYPGCREPSKLFANLYEPIWLPDSTVNPCNYYAAYIYRLTQTYGKHIRFWEVVNEPDFITNVSNKEWLDRAPNPAETTNTLAPIYHYIRTLRITWEVVKKYCPEDYVTPGGLGYAEYLDALLRFTDNPQGGAVTAQYPARGGAYFDVVDYHVYPSYYLRRRNLLHTGFNYQRNSDNAAAQLLRHKARFEAVLRKHGFNGETYPEKHFIITETNISRRTAEWRYSSDEMQRNFGIKALVAAQKNGIRQVHFYSVAEAADAPPEPSGVSSADEFKLMGMYENMNRDLPGREKLTQLGQGFKTTAGLLAGWRYDAARTAALQLPDEVEGAAFRRADQYQYVLWAKTQLDQQETATARYSFPPEWRVAAIERRAWDAGSSEVSTRLPGREVLLDGAPAFFTLLEPTGLQLAAAPRPARPRK
ncbi:hypothetical protein HNQ93_001629 [Hymenobacter luteus]|uniref:Glycoside hydrolase family 5 domain-containing protein n=2 Tax=Hymenobacter TaxID=89966 RepID=A0A7W9T0E4_9BACT|nr:MULTISPECIES: hypothetical protein [Hymenobacter]MBB4601010.1 hypothetical protein [Hymenobacter latericoloratus]MBB6058783.1 hypothetical protein [Hymenobacter luteus]